MESAIEIYAVIHLAVIGLSHVVQPRAWVDFFIFLREQGKAGAFATAFLSLFFGSLVFGLRKLQIPSHERPRLFVYPGLFLLLLAALLACHLWTTA